MFRFVIIMTVTATCAFASDDDAYRVGSPGEHELMMVDYLNGLAFDALESRAAAYEQLETPADVEHYQRSKHDTFVELLGRFPERTPLNPRIVGGGEGDGYRYEKIIYESRPGFHVTAVLFLPAGGEGPFPAVLFPCGHSEIGKAEEAYQRACIMLARHGMAALAYDPIGQGERGQILDTDNTQQFGSTIEHTLVGVGSILLGTNTATYRIWDGIRSMDYLESRDDIDATRIGCTGNSGGGTLTSYLMALDPRIAAAAPSCYVTSFRRLFETIGPQDAEQNIFAFLANGLDHADYINLRAPKPTLVCCATRDFFDIHGTWDTYREAKRTYTRLGFPERLTIVETDAEHGFTVQLRCAMVHWMQRWLMGVDEPVVEPEFSVLPADTLQCTPAGQVLLLDGARSVFDINAAAIAEYADMRAQARRDSGFLDRVRETIAARPMDALPAVEVQEAGRTSRDGYTVQKLLLTVEPGVLVPALVFLPAESSQPPVLYVHGDGKSIDAAPGGPIEAWVKQGHPVLAPDLRGVGETENHQRTYGWETWFGPDWVDYFRAYQAGKSYVGMRVEDILALTAFLQKTAGSSEPIRMIAKAEAVIPAVHAAALHPEHFASVEFDETPSWAETAATPITHNQLVNTVHGALKLYDWVDLVSLLPGN